MKQSTSLHGSKNNRRSFLKIAAITVAGALAACVPGFSDESQALPTPPPVEPILPTSVPPGSEITEATNPPPPTEEAPTSMTPPIDTEVPTATNPPTATEAPTASTAPMGCLPDVECDQAVLSAQNRHSRIIQVRNPNPTHIITGLCLRDGGCVDVCPVDAIVPGKPSNEWPRYYIDPNTCIDCGACIPECPFSAIFPEADVPSQYIARGGEYINRVDICGHYEGTNHNGEAVVLDTVCHLTEGQVVDLTVDIQDNFDFYTIGPGYSALNSG